MKVLELKKLLEKCSDDMEIIIQKDAEGNGYSPLSGVDDNCIYIPDNNWSGEAYSLKWSNEDMDMEETEWEEMKNNNKRVLVLQPTN